MSRYIPFAEYEAARPATEPEVARSILGTGLNQDTEAAVLRQFLLEGSGGAVCVLWAPVGSSPWVLDLRTRVPQPARTAASRPAQDYRAVIARPVGEQLAELQAALSLNKSQLAQVLRVTRPTIYDWLGGNEPNRSNLDRLGEIQSLLAGASVSGARPLNARFVRRSAAIGGPSLLELLGKEAIDGERVLSAIEEVRRLEASVAEENRDREERLRARGFEEPSDEQKRENLARNMALKNWPKP